LIEEVLTFFKIRIVLNEEFCLTDLNGYTLCKMWRAFVNSFNINTYENYLKKHLVAQDIGKNKQKRENSDLVSREAQKMTSDFLDLQKKVQEQRRNIRETDEIRENRRKMKIRRDNQMRLEEKSEKKSFLQRIRSYSNNKAKKKKVLDDLDKESEKEGIEVVKETTFVTCLRPSSPIKAIFRPSTRANSKKNTIKLKEYQEKVMKEFKKTLPRDYYDQLETEFLKIRKKSEETFEQYSMSKKLKKSNPFDIRPKTRACSSIDFLFK
jgi:hypothetical protein